MSTQEKDIQDLLSDPSFRAWVFTSSPDLNLFWENWLIKNPDKREAVKEARILIKALKFDERALAEADKSRLWSRITASNELHSKSGRETKIRPINDRVQYLRGVEPRKQPNYFLRYVAVLAGILTLAVTATLIWNKPHPELEVHMIEKVNEAGQKSTIFLADGTLVNLNASSRLTYPKDFSGEERKVFLQGEAFFKVKKGTKPFVVETEHLKAKVLGTSFNIRAFAEKDEYSLALATGKVMVSPTEAPQDYVILEPGQKGTLDSLTGRMSTTSFDYEEEIAWKEGILVFKDCAFATVRSRLEEWYGVRFVLENEPLEDFLVTGKFDNESLDNVLQSISYTGSFSYAFKENNVHLNFHTTSSPMK